MQKGKSTKTKVVARSTELDRIDEKLARILKRNETLLECSANLEANMHGCAAAMNHLVANLNGCAAAMEGLVANMVAAVDGCTAAVERLVDSIEHGVVERERGYLH
jgi:hypothetical protein